MELKDLQSILNDIPILLVPKIRFRKEMKTYEGHSLAVNRKKPDGTALTYTILAHECDEMTRSLLCASLHHYYWGGLNEYYIELAENIFWDNPHYRKMCQDKVVELCGEQDI